MGAAVGVDLGTTNTVVSAVRDGRPVTLLDPDGRRLLPSVVSFHPSGKVIVGQAARDRMIVDPTSTVFSVKRLIGRAWDSAPVERARTTMPFEIVEGDGHEVVIAARGQRYTLPEISAFVMRRAKAIAEEALGEPVDQVVVTVPANFNDPQREATKLAAKLAGLDVLRILNEPTAAALAYGTAAGQKERVVVYDLGGGTFDVTLLDVSGAVFQVLATGGDTALGGDDVDELVAAKMREFLLRTHRYDVQTDPTARAILKSRAEKLKIELSSQERAEAPLNDFVRGEGGKFIEIEFALDRSTLAGMVGSMMERTLETCRKTLAKAGFKPSNMNRVILVGGATRMPLVGERVEAFFNQRAAAHVNPDEVVAHGAAIQAAALARATVAKPAQPRARPSFSFVVGPPKVASSPAPPEPPAAPPPATAVAARQDPAPPRMPPAPPPLTPSTPPDRPPPASTLPRPLLDRSEPGGRTSRPPISRDEPSTGPAKPLIDRVEPSSPPPQLRSDRPDPRGRSSRPPLAREEPLASVAAPSTPPARAPIAREDDAPVSGAKAATPSASPPPLSQGQEELLRAFLGAASPEPGPVSRPPPASSPPKEPSPDVEAELLAFLMGNEKARAAAGIVAVADPLPKVPPFVPSRSQPAPVISDLPPVPDLATAPVPAPLPASEPPAAVRSSSEPPEPSAPPRVVPPPLLIDVTPISLGVETVGGFFDAIIGANSPVPCDRTRVFRTASDGQSSVVVRIAQGESERFDENTNLGNLLLSGFRSAPRGEVQIAVTFEIDSDGILNVRAAEAGGSRVAKARIELVGAQNDATKVEAMMARQAAHDVV